MCHTLIYCTYLYQRSSAARSSTRKLGWPSLERSMRTQFPSSELAPISAPATKEEGITAATGPTAYCRLRNVGKMQQGLFSGTVTLNRGGAVDAEECRETGYPHGTWAQVILRTRLPSAPPSNRNCSNVHMLSESLAALGETSSATKLNIVLGACGRSCIMVQ